MTAACRFGGFVLCALAAGATGAAASPAALTPSAAEPEKPPPYFGLVEPVVEPLPKGLLRLGEVAFNAPGLSAVHFTADGKSILAGMPEEIREWNLDTKTPTRRYRLEGVSVRELTSTPDGRFLLVGDWESVYVVSRADGKLVHRVRADTDGDAIACFAVSPDGHQLAVGARRGTLTLRDLLTGKPLPFKVSHPKLKPVAEPFRLVEATEYVPPIAHVAFSPDGKTVASAATGGTVRAWDVATAKEVWALDPAVVGGGAFAFSPDGKHVLAQQFGPEPPRMPKGPGGRRPPALRAVGYALWSVADRKPVVELEGEVYATTVAFSPDGRFVAAGGGTHRFQVWDAATGKEKFSAPLSSAVSALDFSRDGKLVACAGGSFELRDSATGRDVLGENGHTGPVGTAAVSGDGKLIVTGGAEGTVRVWDAETGKQRLRVFHGQRIACVAIAPDRATFASAAGDGTVRVWNTTTGKELRRFEFPNDQIETVAYSPDGKLIGVGGHDLTVHLFDATTGKKTAVLVGYDGYEQNGGTVFRFSPDGRHLAALVHQGPGGTAQRAGNPDPPPPPRRSRFDPTLGPAGDADGKWRVALWDVGTGKRVRLVGPPAEHAPGFAFSREGDLIAVGGYGLKQVEVVSVKTGAVRQRLDIPDAYLLEFTPDGDLFAGPACYDLDTGEVAVRLPEGHGPLAVMPDGRRAVVWGRGAASVWTLPAR